MTRLNCTIFLFALVACGDDDSAVADSAVADTAMADTAVLDTSSDVASDTAAADSSTRDTSSSGSKALYELCEVGVDTCDAPAEACLELQGFERTMFSMCTRRCDGFGDMVTCGDEGHCVEASGQPSVCYQKCDTVTDCPFPLSCDEAGSGTLFCASQPGI